MLIYDRFRYDSSNKISALFGFLEISVISKNWQISAAFFFVLAAIPAGSRADPEKKWNISTHTTIDISSGQEPTQNDAKAINAIYENGRQYSQNQAWAKAIGAYSEVLALQPGNVDARLLRGYAFLFEYLSKNLLIGSREDFQRALFETPDYQDAQEGLRKVEALLKNPAEPTEGAERVEAEPKNPERANKMGEEAPVDLSGKPFEILNVTTQTSINLLTEGSGPVGLKATEAWYQKGRQYSQLQNWDKAIDAYTQVLELQPANSDALVGRGYARMFEYLSLNLLLQAKEDFQRVLTENPNYKDAQVGLDRVEKILKVKLPELRAIKEESKKKSEQIAAEAAEKVSLEEKLLEYAKNLAKQEDHWAAAQIYEELTEIYPKNPDYFFFLGLQYAVLEEHCLAIEALEKALELAPKYIDVLLALANQSVALENFCIARDYIVRALDIQPNHVDALIRLAQVEALLDHPALAEEIFYTTWNENFQRTDILRPYANFLLSQRRFTESEWLFRSVEAWEDDEANLRPTLFDLSSYTMPSAFLRFNAAQERERDLFTHRPVASLTYINGDVAVSYPRSDRLRGTIRLGAGNTSQKLLVSGLTQFSVKAVGAEFKAEIFYDPLWTITANGRVEWIFNSKKNVVLTAQRRTNFMPSLIARYSDGKNLVIFGELSDSIIYRDFSRNRLLVPTRTAGTFLYQYDFGKQRLIGLDGTWIWYLDPIHNQEQLFNGWLQTGIPYFEDLFSIRYHCLYRHFLKQTTAYYSFVFELTHWLRAHIFKRWPSGIHCDLEYWHGWRTTRGRNPQQQLIVGPAPAILPNTTVENQIDQVFFTLGYMPSDSLDLALAGSYYHDSFDYLVIGARAFIEWRF